MARETESRATHTLKWHGKANCVPLTYSYGTGNRIACHSRTQMARESELRATHMLKWHACPLTLLVNLDKARYFFVMWVFCFHEINYQQLWAACLMIISWFSPKLMHLDTFCDLSTGHLLISLLISQLSVDKFIILIVFTNFIVSILSLLTNNLTYAQLLTDFLFISSFFVDKSLPLAYL